MSDPANWRIERHGTRALVRCAALARVSGVAHAFSTRLVADETEADFGGADASAAVIARRRSFLVAAGIGGARPAMPAQVHGNRLVAAEEIREAQPPPAADGVIAWRDRGTECVPAVRVADCVPVLLAEVDGRAVAAVHAGWRGTAEGIVGRALEAFARGGVGPERLVAAFGPAIGVCCYAVGEEVVERLARASGVRSGGVIEGGGRVDLHRANRLQLERAGVRPEAIHAAPWCTACHSGLFHSHRRDGALAGRMMACIGWSGPERAGPRP